MVKPKGESFSAGPLLRSQEPSSVRAAVSTTASAAAAKGPSGQSPSRVTRQTSKSKSPNRVKRAKQDQQTPRARSASTGQQAATSVAAVADSTPLADAAPQARATRSQMRPNAVTAAMPSPPPPTAAQRAAANAAGEAQSQQLQRLANHGIAAELWTPLALPSQKPKNPKDAARAATLKRQNDEDRKKATEDAAKRLKDLGTNLRKANKCRNKAANHTHGPACGHDAPVDVPAAQPTSGAAAPGDANKAKKRSAATRSDEAKRVKNEEEDDDMMEAEPAQPVDDDDDVPVITRRMREAMQKTKDEETEQQAVKSRRSARIAAGEVVVATSDDEAEKRVLRSAQKMDQEEEKTSPSKDEDDQQDVRPKKDEEESSFVQNQADPKSLKRAANSTLDLPAPDEKKARSDRDQSIEPMDDSSAGRPASSRGGAKKSNYVDRKANNVANVAVAHAKQASASDSTGSLTRSSKNKNTRKSLHRSVKQHTTGIKKSIRLSDKLNRAGTAVTDLNAKAQADIQAKKKEKKGLLKPPPMNADVLKISEFVVAKMAEERAAEPDADNAYWDFSEKQMNELKKRVRDEGTLVDPYTKEVAKKYAKMMEKELTKRKLPVNKDLFKKFYWKIVYASKDVGHKTHPTMKESTTWTEKRKGDRWRIKEVLAVLRLISIGSICESCLNPFKLSKQRLERVGCNCPKKTEALWKGIPIGKWSGRAKLERPKDPESWLAEKKIQLFIEKAEKHSINFTRLMMAELLREDFNGNKKKFEDAYPFWNVPLNKRTDWVGKAAYKEQQALYRMRCDADYCPSFIFEWTGKTRDISGGIGMPHQWIHDAGTTMSAGVEEAIAELRNGRAEPALTKCNGDCSKQHVCCTGTIGWSTSWTIGSDGLIRRQKSCMLPGGVDDKECPRQCWEYDNSLLACDEKCGCSNKCPKKFLQKGPEKMIIIFNQPATKGWATYTAEEIVRGEYIGTFSGHIMTSEELDTTAQDQNMFFDMTPVGGWTGDEQSSFTLTTCIRSNELKYVNHACCPNTLIVRTYGRNDGEYTHGIALFARQRIRAFKEISYDYFKRADIMPFVCQCGGYACRGGAVAAAAKN